MQPIEERLELVRFKVDKTAHIRVNTETCQECDTTPCLFVCPAGLFELLGDEMHFSYEHCFECGTCYVACERKAIEWSYPRGGWASASAPLESMNTRLNWNAHNQPCHSERSEESQCRKRDSSLRSE